MKEKTKENIFWFMAGAMTISLLFGLTILVLLDLSTLSKMIELIIK